MHTYLIRSLLIATLYIAGCASLPEGPNVTVLPGSGKTFDHFRQDDAVCRDYARSRIGGKSPQLVSSESTQQSAVVGTVLGTAAGAVIGGEHGAGVGAATGLIFGSLAGLDSGLYAGNKQQQRYDGAYIQCMYAKGHRVPVTGQLTSSHSSNRSTIPPANGYSQVPPDFQPYPPANYPPPPGY